MRKCLQAKYTEAILPGGFGVSERATAKRRVSLSFYASFSPFRRLFTQGPRLSKAPVQFDSPLWRHDRVIVRKG